MTGPIFGSSSGGSSNGRHLVEFRAGRMNMVGKMVHPDKRKGLLYVYQADDMLIHFCWKDVTTGVVEDDLIIFPDDCEFKRVDQCKTGRVFLLKFKASNRRLFFWMQQESKTDNDEDLCRRVNDAINNPPTGGGGGGSGRGGGADSNDLQYMINNMSPQQLVQLFNGVNQMGGLNSIFGNRDAASSNSRASPSSGGTATTPAVAAAAAGAATPTTATTGQSTATPQAPRKGTTTTRRPGASQETPASGAARTTGESTPGTDSNNVLLSELRNFLSGLSPGQEGTAAAPISGGSVDGPNVDFSTAITTEALNPLLNDNPDWIAQLEEHLPDVGTDDTKKQQLRDTISSPQFQQALGMFSSALQSGQLGPVVSQFKLSNEAVQAANLGDLEKFVRALENSAKEVATKGKAAGAEAATTTTTEEKKNDGAEDEDDEMAG